MPPTVLTARTGVGKYLNRSSTMLPISLRSHAIRHGMCAAAIAAIVLSTGAHPIGMPAAPAHAAGPCDAITGNPREPIGPGQPDVIGHITAASTNSPISGATVRLYVCTGSTPELVAATTTDMDGVYVFADLSGPAWYYVQAVLIGPLSGMSSAVGTSNPTALIDVGQGASAVDLAFQ